jgi:hypothetical protein
MSVRAYRFYHDAVSKDRESSALIDLNDPNAFGSLTVFITGLFNNVLDTADDQKRDGAMID